MGSAMISRASTRFDTALETYVVHNEPMNPKHQRMRPKAKGALHKRRATLPTSNINVRQTMVNSLPISARECSG
jgi:hypothetical protein